MTMIHEHLDSDFGVKFIGKSTIRASNLNTKPNYVLSLSNFDHLICSHQLTILYAYRRPSSGDFSSIVAAIKGSLGETLHYFPPFAGRIVPNNETGEAEILCNNQGVELIEASAETSLATIDFHDLNKCEILLPYAHEHPLSMQVTAYACGGFSIAWNFNHKIGDAFTFNMLILSWSEIARTKRISVVPDHDRTIFLPRSPPSYGPLLDRTYTVFTLDEILNNLPSDISTKRLYYIDGSAVDRLRAISSEGGTKRTRTESFSAYLWKVMATTLGKTDATCQMGWAVDGRSRFDRDNRTMSNYVGNLVSMAVGEASIDELKQASLSHVAGVVSRAIGEVTNEAHFLELVDWIECNRPGPMMPKIVLGRGGPAIVVSSNHHLPAMAMDFGFGRPRLGTYYSAATKKRIGAGYVNIVESGRGDGSWFVFAVIWPRLAAALESDPEHVFQPITADQVGF